MYLDIPTETFSGFWMLRGFFLLRSCWRSDTNSWPSTGSKVNKSKNLSASRKSMRNIMKTHIFWSIQKSYATSQLHHFKRWKSKAKKTMAASKHRPRPSIACVKNDVSLPLPLISNFILPAMSRPWPYNPQPTFPPLPRSPAGAGPSSPSSVGLREALRSIAAEVERGRTGTTGDYARPTPGDEEKESWSFTGWNHGDFATWRLQNIYFLVGKPIHFWWETILWAILSPLWRIRIPTYFRLEVVELDLAFEGTFFFRFTRCQQDWRISLFVKHQEVEVC